MVSVTGYSYPWDFRGDPDAAVRARDVGLDAVALAATYHAARVASPLHPTRRVTEVPYSALYTPFRAASWREHRLVPRAAQWLGGENAFLEAQRALTAVGLAIDAWLVLTHYDDAGHDHPELVTRNAFDEPSNYSLCPSGEAVREYCLTLVEEVLTTTTCRGVVLEACGPMGLEHGGVHDKVEFANFTTTDECLLALCFCPTCRRGLAERDVDAEDLARRVRAAVGSGAASPSDALGEDLAARVGDFRVSLSTALRAAVVERVHALRPGAPVTLHASGDPWATGSFPAAGPRGTLRGVTTLVANCWNPDSAASELASLNAVRGGDAYLGGYVRLDQGWSDAARARDVIAQYAKLGMSELHLYHLGLISRTGLAAARALTRALRNTEGQSINIADFAD